MNWDQLQDIIESKVVDELTNFRVPKYVVLDKNTYLQIKSTNKGVAHDKIQTTAGPLNIVIVNMGRDIVEIGTETDWYN